MLYSQSQDYTFDQTYALKEVTREYEDFNKHRLPFDEFGDSSVEIAVKQYVLVAERNSYIAQAKEAIYNTLNGNGISIPFPQRDIHIVKEG